MTLHPDDLHKLITTEVGKEKVSVPLADLKEIMRAAKRCLAFLTMSDLFESGYMTCEATDMLEAYKRVDVLAKDTEKFGTEKVKRKLNI